MSSQPLLSWPKSLHHTERLAECRSNRGAIWYQRRCGSTKCCNPEPSYWKQQFGCTKYHCRVFVVAAVTKLFRTNYLFSMLLDIKPGIRTSAIHPMVSDDFCSFSNNIFLFSSVSVFESDTH